MRETLTEIAKSGLDAARAHAADVELAVEVVVVVRCGRERGSARTGSLVRALGILRAEVEGVSDSILGLRPALTDYLDHIVGCPRCSAAWRSRGEETMCEDGGALAPADSETERALIAFSDMLLRGRRS
jgi:hypothetical protein